MKRLSQSDVSFMLRVLELPVSLRDLFASRSDGDVAISDEDADALRDICGERLQTHGFNEHYQPTQEGKQLEELIDKLYVG
jgi:hypothetical protein